MAATALLTTRTEATIGAALVIYGLDPDQTADALEALRELELDLLADALEGLRPHLQPRKATHGSS